MTSPHVNYRISVSVMAHPSRAAEAATLSAQLGGRARTVYDPVPNGARSTIRTAREAWHPWDKTATHHLVIQDDCTLDADFAGRLGQCVASQPLSVLSLFSEWGSFTAQAVRIAAMAGRSWIQPVDSYIPTQAVVMPVSAAERFARALKDVPEDVPDDHALFDFVAGDGLDFLVSIPHLVQHDGTDSLTGNDWHGRRQATVLFKGPLPEGWWDRRPMRELQAVPSMHWRILEPSIRSRPAADGLDWSLDHALPSLGDDEERVRDVLLAEFLEATAPALATASCVLSQRILALADITFRQTVAAHHVRSPSEGRLVEGIVTSAVRTALPGVLRASLGEILSSADLSTISDHLAELVRASRTSLAAI